MFMLTATKAREITKDNQHLSISEVGRQIQDAAENGYDMVLFRKSELSLQIRAELLLADYAIRDSVLKSFIEVKWGV